ncbi:MAG: GIN domain-containing protein, partial [Chitinophagaceae bacterium]
VKWKDDINVSTDNNVKLTITTPVLEEIYVQGSGNVKSTNKFTGGNELKIKISGSGDVKLAVNTPKVSSSISGSGNISLEGETKENNIEISGVGDYNASELLAESASVKISGSGNVKLHADANLNVKISGSGDVFYKGSPAITESISGSGSIKQLNN